MKKVLQISNYYYPHFGGIEQVARDISNALKNEEAFEQKVICFNEDSIDGDHVCHRAETIHDIVDGVEIIKCGCFAKVASQSLSLTFGRELRRQMREFDPDVVVFHYPNPFQAHYLLKYRRKAFKLALYWHLDITKQKILKHLFYHQNLALIERAQCVLGATPMHVDKSEFTERFGAKKQVLPYMIDTTKLSLSEEERILSQDIRKRYGNSVIGFFIGRHVPYKGLKYLIEASRELEGENVKFLLAGEGELTQELKEQAKGDDKIVFLGRITDSEKRAYYDACDFICFPSITRNEGFGLALAEGMYFSKPAVTFYIYGSGVNYVNLDGVTGIECPNGDSHAFAEAVKKLALDPKLRQIMGQAAKRRVEENFTPEQFQKRIKQLINSL